ncbi:hypothetical protein DY102_03880 [Apilactobacillus timberlakei]|uniref:hypothetical protein n=1 Tax=Apilactobacillus timberlakei TaxID=2008380 RepID=UPI001125C012|nr:hypothetical protein [Apilactobacillus timberlakei]TPR23190.1 hypothetical protein DY102_03880 [Apilactobacillus timberlakei]
MLKKFITILSIIIMSLSFSCVSLNAINNGENVYASSHRKIRKDDEGFWQRIWDGIKTVQD